MTVAPNHWFILLVGLLSMPSSPCAQGAEKGDAALDWQRSDWRYHLTFRPPRYQTPTKEGDRLRDLRSYARGWHVALTQAHVHSPEAPADWMNSEFDDARWCRQRGGPGAGSSWYDPVVRVMNLRGKFEVVDPSKATGLKVDIEYIGGVVVYLNGQEVGRGHLPKGALTGDTLAEGYPLEAYEWDIPVKPDGYPMAPTEWKPRTDPKEERWRRLETTLDPKLLRAGTNVLAVAFHGSPYHGFAARWHTEAMNGYKLTPWPHLLVRSLKLTGTVSAASASAAPASVRISTASSADLRVWVEDMHRRVVSRDLPEPALQAPTIRLVGARNGSYSAQVVVRSGKPLNGLSASVSDLAQAGGSGKVAASAVQVRYGVATAVDALRSDYANRHIHFYTPSAGQILNRYGSGFKKAEDRVNPSKELQAEARSIAIFDQLSSTPPKAVPASTCQPVWITVKVPKDQAAGEYRGTLRIQVGGTTEVPVRLMVFDWALPDAKDFGSFVGMHHSLLGVHQSYKVPLWSKEHWGLVEESLRHLGEVGNDLAVLPLVVEGEQKNEEALVAWIKKGDGYEYDWTHFDRYLDLVGKHLGKQAALVGEVGFAPQAETPTGWALRHAGVTLLDPASGKKTKLALPAAGSEEWQKLFVPYAKAVRQRLKDKGFATLYWGWFYDNPNPIEPLAKALFAEIPDVGWARSSHDGFRKGTFPRGSKAPQLDLHIRGFPQSFNRNSEPESQQGWKQPGNLLFPRAASEIMAIGPFDAPMCWRSLTENCLVNGASGVGRLGADYWPPFEFRNWYAPFVLYLLHPGPKGAEAGAMFEAFREGIQEAEVRIQLERSGKDKTEPAKTVLGDRIRLLGAIPTGPMYSEIGAYHGGWQERSWDLYSAAAASFGKAPAATEKGRFFGK